MLSLLDAEQLLRFRNRVQLAIDETTTRVTPVTGFVELPPYLVARLG